MGENRTLDLLIERLRVLEQSLRDVCKDIQTATTQARQDIAELRERIIRLEMQVHTPNQNNRRLKTQWLILAVLASALLSLLGSHAGTIIRFLTSLF